MSKSTPYSALMPSANLARDERVIRFESSVEPADPEWDDFLESCALGQFQQSSKWGRLKSHEGWTVQRLKAYSDNALEGGFQVLWKTTRFGRLGYVTKGPVWRTAQPQLVKRLLDLLHDTARRLGLRGLIAQLPDFSAVESSELHSRGFSNVSIPGIIDATLLLDVGLEWSAVESAMSGRLRGESRQAAKRGVTVAEGTIADAPAFFDLMLSTCQRQGAIPNPSKPELVEAICREFGSRAHLWFAHLDGRKVAGLLLIGFGDRLTLWKKGWSSAGKGTHPNVLLHTEVIRWAHQMRYKWCDFAAVDRQIAEQFASGQPLTEEQLKSRHLFNLRLGAEPRLLPQAQILIVNPILRAVFDRIGNLPLGRRALRRMSV